MNNKEVEKMVENVASVCDEVQFLHGVPVSLPSETKALLRGRIREALRTAIENAKREGIRDTVACFTTHDEGFGAYCDTGEDMGWSCRSDCVEHGVNRARRLCAALSLPVSE